MRGARVPPGLGRQQAVLSAAVGMQEWALLRIAHLEHLPSTRWKLHKLAQLQKADAKKFAEQADVLATKHA